MKMPFLFSTLLVGFSLFMADISAVSWWEMTPWEVRERINQRIMSIEAPIPPVKSIQNQVIECESRETPIRIYTPYDGTDLPIIVLIHGGAWVAGNLDTHDNLARYLCSEVKALVVSVGYLNAPEGKFPLPLQQCYDTLTWIQGHANEFLADPSRIAIVGDSAGGNMTAALCLMARDQGKPNIQLQVLINPAPDLTCQGTVERQNDDLDLLRWQVLQYLSNPQDAYHPYVSPQVATDLSHLPPAVVLLAEKDDLREAGQKYAERLLAANIPTLIYCQQGIGHLAGHGARASLQARESLDVAIAALKQAFLKIQIE